MFSFIHGYLDSNPEEFLSDDEGMQQLPNNLTRYNTSIDWRIVVPASLCVLFFDLLLAIMKYGAIISSAILL
ncbi:MAG: hypothetical protein FWG88_06430 [Oscillospiraceae bacterium]|nr:hypothetical protein [Oscillospiraceae bacterium]